MKVPEKLTKTELLILILTVVFLSCTGAMFALHIEQENEESYHIHADIVQQEWKDALYAAEAELQILGPVAPTTENPLNINLATAEELDMLPKIGPVLAERIIAYREKNGSFVQKEQIMDVKGIGNGIYAEIQELISIKEAVK